MRIVNFASESCIESQYQQYHKILSTELLLWFHTVYTAIKENKSEILRSLHYGRVASCHYLRRY